MGFPSSEKAGVVIAGVPLRAPLKPIYTGDGEERESGRDDEFCRTPTSDASRISEKLPCPPPPKKRKPARCSNNGKIYGGKTREFFAVPHDLEAVFIRRHNVGW